MEVDQKILPNILRGLAHSVSLKQYQHLIQLAKSGNFSFFDYEKMNKKIYNLMNSTTPSEYPIKNIKCPTYIYSGSNDAVVNESDLALLAKALPNVRKYQNFKNFNHCDFNYGNNTRKLMFESILGAFNSERK